MEKAIKKTERLWQLEQILLSHPHGLRKSALARRIGVHRSTVSRYIDELSSLLPIYEDDDGSVLLDRNCYLNNIRITIHEAIIFHLATCLFADRTDRNNPHAASALRKLGTALQNFSPVISSNILQSAEHIDSGPLKFDKRFIKNLETITLAWANRQLTEIRHFSMREKRVKQYIFGIYFITVYSPGQTLQIIGKSPAENHLRTLRLDRIEEVRLLGNTYALPDNFNPFDIIRSAWGIWYTDEKPVKVVLKFSSRVAGRVLETQWHATQTTQKLQDDSLIWKVTIDEPREMLPWIRGWGADVEVLEPEWLRKHIAEELKEAAEIYEKDD